MLRYTVLRYTACLSFLAVALTAVAQVPADAADRRATIVALERMWNDAQLNRDATAVASMISDRFVNTEYDGEVSTRAQFLAEFADPKFRPSVMNIQNVGVEMYGATAIVTGDYHTKGIYAGKPYEHFGRFTDTWVYQGLKWVCVASHTSLVKK